MVKAKSAAKAVEKIPKLNKVGKATPDEKAAAGYLVELAQDRKESELKNLYITGVKKVDIGTTHVAIVVFFPVPLLMAFRQVHVRC